MRARFIKPAAIATLRAIALEGAPVSPLAILSRILPYSDGYAWLSAVLAESGSVSDYAS